MEVTPLANGSIATQADALSKCLIYRGRYTVASNSTLSIAGAGDAFAHSFFFYTMGTWNYSEVALIRTQNGSTPSRSILARGPNTVDGSYVINAYGKWGFSIKNATSVSQSIFVIELRQY